MRKILNNPDKRGAVLNIRLTYKDKDRILQLAKKKNKTITETVLYLLNKGMESVSK